MYPLFSFAPLSFLPHPSFILGSSRAAMYGHWGYFESFLLYQIALCQRPLILSLVCLKDGFLGIVLCATYSRSPLLSTMGNPISPQTCHNWGTSRAVWDIPRYSVREFTGRAHSPPFVPLLAQILALSLLAMTLPKAPDQLWTQRLPSAIGSVSSGLFVQ